MMELTSLSLISFCTVTWKIAMTSRSNESKLTGKTHVACSIRMLQRLIIFQTNNFPCGFTGAAENKMIFWKLNCLLLIVYLLVLSLTLLYKPWGFISAWHWNDWSHYLKHCDSVFLVRKGENVLILIIAVRMFYRLYTFIPFAQQT